MKKLLYTLAAVLVCTGAAAQNPTLYFMEGVPLRSQMNPALAPQRGYFNIPVLGGLAVTAGGNTSLDHLLFRRDGRLVTLLSPSVSSADALSDLHSENLVNADIRVNLLGFGAYTANRKHFWSFDLNLRTSVSTQFPYELFHFFKTGESAQVRNLGLSSDAYAEAGFNYSFPIGEKFYVGARVKFLVGLARAKSYFTQFNVSLGENEWYAEAVGELEVNSNLLTIPTRQEAGQDGVYRNYYQLDDMEFDAKFKPAGYGAAFDIGATYEPIPNLLVSAAINDIGFIAWNKASSMHGTVSRRLTFDGAQVDASGVADIDFDLGELKFEQVDEESATRMLHYTMNLGAEYRLWDRRVGFGALYQIHKYDYAALHKQGRMNFNLGIGVPMGKRGLRQRDCIRVNAACCPSQEPLTEQQELRIREQQLREQASATSEQIEEATERSEKAIRKAERRAAKAERKARKAAERAQQEGDTASVVRAAADLLAVRY